MSDSDQNEDPCLFTFSENGFCIDTNAEKKNIEWNEIESIMTFKLDEYTHDEIFLDIFCKDGYSLRLSDKSADWKKFGEEMIIHLKGAKKDWYEKVIVPPFTPSLAVVYDSENRLVNELEQKYYR